MEQLQNVTEALGSAADDAVASFFSANAQVTPATTATPVEQQTTQQAPPELDEQKKDDENEGEEDQQTALPEGYVAVQPVTDGLVTEFSVRDAEGELEVPNLTIEYKANGRIRKDRLDQVVKLAQVGVFNVEREQKLAAREQATQAEVSQYKENLTIREQQLEALLSDPDMYEAARERYMQANAPEQRVVRLEQQLKQREADQQKQVMATTAATFIQQEVIPALDTIAEACPEVTHEELSAQLATAMYSLMENGVVPPHKYPLIRGYIINQLTDWAEDTHARRFSRVRSATQEADKKVEAAQVQSQRVKRQVARATKPTGRGGAPAQGVSGQRDNPNASVSDLLESATQDAMKGFFRGSGN